MRSALGASTAAAAICLAGAGCGASAPAHGRAAAKAPTAAVQSSAWGALRLRSGAVLPYPLSWRRLAGDPGSASAALLIDDHTVRAYLNATPAQAGETLADWGTFRVQHNAAEGDRHVRLLSARIGFPFGAQRRSCVTDEYATRVTSYRELACIVAPANGSQATVLVAAAQPDAWTTQLPALNYAINHFTG